MSIASFHRYGALLSAKLLSLIIATLFTLHYAWGSPLNIGLIHTQENQDADLVLSEVPRNMTLPSAEITIRWTPNNVRGTLRFSSDYNGDSPESYQNVVENVIESSPGIIRFEGNQLPVGYLYCIIDAGDNGYSVVFNIIRASDRSPTMVAPITGAGRLGINTITPSVRWEAVNGVPFYHVIVSDQPFDIIEDDQGTRVEGANVIWQAITSETSIQYGIPDPSEFFDNDQVAPLIGSLNREDRPRYAWVVLNNYAGHPAYTSPVTGGVSGFEVEVAPPFDEPENISPQTRSSLSSEEIVFRWSEVEEAVSYFVYVTREEISEGGSRALVPAWNAQTTLTSVACPASSVLPNGRFIWKVLAASRQGRGTMSDTSSFLYEVRSGSVVMTTTTTEDNILENVEIQVETVDGPGVQSFATDDNGHALRRLAVGRYFFHGVKAGFSDTTSSQITIEEDQRQNITLRLRPIPNSIVWPLVNENRYPFSGPTDTDSHVPGNEETSAETNISGAYQILVAQGNYLVSVSAPGRRPPEVRSIGVPRGGTVDLNTDNGPFVLTAYRYNISGYVRNGNGQPINSATIFAISPDGDETRLYTPEAGNYSFMAGQGVWRINAVKPGFYLESGEQSVRVNDRNLDINFTLLPQAGIFSGQVTIDGTPANRNAEVWLIPSAGQVTTTPVNQVGAFSRGVSPGDYIAVAVRDGFHTSDSLRLSIGPGETISGLRLGLEANPSSISGRVNDGGGNPLRGAQIVASGVSTTSDANGSYTLRLAAGSHTLVATKDGFVTAERGPVSVQSGQNLGDIDLRLVDNAGTISGVIRRGNDAIFEAIITATRQGGDGSRFTTRSGRDGSYSFGITFGSYRLTVQKDGFIAANPGYIDVQLQPGQVVNGRNFPMLAYSGRIVGNVSSPSGVVNTPSIRITQLDDPNRNYTTNGNIQGDYALGIAPERRYIVTSSKAGFSTVSDTTARLEIEGEIVVNQRLTPLPCIISGTVTTGNVALLGATVRADGQAGSFQSTTDRLGRFSVSLQPGSYRVTASKPGYTAVEREVRINPGENLERIDFAPEANFALVAGIVRDPDGAGISGSIVTVIDSMNQRSITTQTNNDGAYQLEGIIPGNYYLIASNNRFRRNVQNLGAVMGRQERRGINLTLVPLAARITGQVTSSGNVVPSATVYATEDGGEQFSARTDNNGRFVIENMSDGRFAVRPAIAGFTGVVRENVQVNPADTISLDLEMIRNNGQITGYVRDPDGAGLRDVRVSAIDSLGNFAAVSTNAAGQYSLDNLYPLTRYRLSPRLNGYTPEQDTVSNVGNGGEVIFRLLPNELRLSGRVVNQIGQGIAGTELIATSENDGSVFRANANEAGDYTFTGFGANTSYRIQTQRIEEYYANADTTIRIQVNHLDIGSRLRIIERRASIRGLIRSNNVGVSDVSITTRNLTTGRQRSTYTTGDGTYRVLGMRGGDFGNYVIRASKHGFIVRQPDSLRVEGLGIAEERANVNFTVDEILVSISGRVIDSATVAMNNVPVTAWAETGQVRDTTDINGVFSFTGLFPNQHYSLSSELPRDGYENSSTSFDVAQVDVSGIILTIGRHNAVVSGLVSDAAGSPLPGASIVIDNGRDSRSTGEDGRYRFEFVAPGNHSLVFSRAGFLTVQTVVDAANGEGEFVRNVTLTALDAAIYGSVTTTTDRSFVPGVVMRLISDAADTLYDTTNSNGSFQFNRLDPLKNYTVRSSRKGYETFTRTGLNIAAGNVDIQFQISPPVRGIYGRFLTPDGLPVIGAEIRVRSFTNQLFRDVTDHFGDYLADVGTGTYSVIGVAAQPLTETSRSLNINVLDGASQQVNLRLEETGRAVGRLTLEDGTPPLTSGKIFASHDATGDVYFDIAGNDGSFELAGLRPGHYTLVAEAAGYAMQVNPYPFEARLSETVTLTISMTQSGKAITGYVLTSDGDGIERAHVTLTGNSPGTFETDGKGYWSKPGPMAGRYTVSINKNGYQHPADTTFDLSAGGIVEINRTIAPNLMTLSGRLTGVNGAPYENGTIYLLSNSQLLDSALTDHYGEYEFTSLDAISYELRAQVPGYIGNPASRSFQLTVDGYGLDQDFTLTAVRGFGIVYGVIRHDTLPVSTQISIVDLQTGSRYGGVSDANGSFRITQIPTPSQFSLTATYPDVPDVSSQSFLLQTGEEQARDMIFPSGQIRIRLLNAEGNPIVGRKVFVSGLSVNFTAILYSDGTGFARTVDWLPVGRYSVTPEALVGMLPPSPKQVELGANEARELTWFLGWRFTPPPPFSFEDSSRVEILVPGAVTVSDADLYFRGPGVSSFSSVSLQRMADGSPGRGSRSVNPELPAVTDFDASVTYYGYIPPQGRSGTLTYYLQVNTADGYVFGGPESAQDVTISARGLLDHLELIRSQAALQPRPGVLMKLTVSGYDDGNNDLTTRLQTEGHFEWTQVGENRGRLVVDPQDSSFAYYFPETIGPVEIRSRVSQPSTGVIISKSLQWENADASVARMQVAAHQFEIRAGDSLRFTVTATDTAGVLVPLAPRWTITPGEVATVSPVPFSMDALLRTTPGVIGKVQVTATDSISKVSAMFNDDSPDRSQHGLAIYAEIRSGGTDTTLVHDGLGFEIKIPPGSLPANTTARIFLNEPRLTPVFRLTPKFELEAVGYNVGVEGSLDQHGAYLMTFPVPVEFRTQTPTVGVWNSTTIDWDVIEGEFNGDQTKVTIEVSSLNGLYALISASEALGVRDLKFSPNPFSPQSTKPGLSIEFRLTSDMADRPNLSVMIYNMQGQLIRKLIDSRLMPKGDYRRGGENELIWDGMTDDNREARNGRFIVVLIARDASGESKVVGSAVLIK